MPRSKTIPRRSSCASGARIATRPAHGGDPGAVHRACATGEAIFRAPWAMARFMKPHLTELGIDTASRFWGDECPRTQLHATAPVGIRGTRAAAQTLVSPRHRAADVARRPAMPRTRPTETPLTTASVCLASPCAAIIPLFEVGVATDPALFRVDNAARNRRNFFSSRSSGAPRVGRGEAVYSVPPDALEEFHRAAEAVFGLATYRENSKGVDHAQVPGARTMDAQPQRPDGAGPAPAHRQAHGEELRKNQRPRLQLSKCGRRRWPQPASTGTAAAPTGAATSSTNANPPAPYDDGFGLF